MAPYGEFGLAAQSLDTSDAVQRRPWATKAKPFMAIGGITSAFSASDEISSAFCLVCDSFYFFYH
jgi:hypothetical protein